jgi:predicted nucleic acid-binding protein
LSAFVDTNVLVRHLTSDPPELAARATAYLGTERELLLTDLVAAETVSVVPVLERHGRRLTGTARP